MPWLILLLAKLVTQLVQIYGWQAPSKLFTCIIGTAHYRIASCDSKAEDTTNTIMSQKYNIVLTQDIIKSCSLTHRWTITVYMAELTHKRGTIPVCALLGGLEETFHCISLRVSSLDWAEVSLLTLFNVGWFVCLFGWFWYFFGGVFFFFRNSTLYLEEWELNNLQWNLWMNLVSLWKWH